MEAITTMSPITVELVVGACWSGEGANSACHSFWNTHAMTPRPKRQTSSVQAVRLDEANSMIDCPAKTSPKNRIVATSIRPPQICRGFQVTLSRKENNLVFMDPDRKSTRLN